MASSTPSLFGSASPAVGGGINLLGTSAPTQPSLFGQSQPSLFGQTQPPQSQPAIFGQTQSAQSPPSLFGQPQASQPQPSIFGQSQPAQSPPSLFGQSQPSLFGQPPSQPSLFGQPPSQPSLFGQSQPSIFGQFSPQPSYFGQSTPSLFATPTQQQTASPFTLGGLGAAGVGGGFGGAGLGGGLGGGGGQLQTLFAPTAPLAIPLPDAELGKIVGAYTDDPNNTNYKFTHLFLSVTHPAMRGRHVAVAEDMWQAAMRQLEGMSAEERERLWPEVAMGFKALSNRLKLQDEALASDAHRLRVSDSNVRHLQRHFEADTLPTVQRLQRQQKTQERRLLRLTRILQALETKGFGIPLSNREIYLGKKLRLVAAETFGSQADLPRRAESVLSAAKLEAGQGGWGGMGGVEGEAGRGQIADESLQSILQMLQRQTEALAKLTAVMQKDARDVDIMFAQGGA